MNTDELVTNLHAASISFQMAKLRLAEFEDDIQMQHQIEEAMEQAKDEYLKAREQLLLHNPVQLHKIEIVLKARTTCNQLPVGIH